MIGRRKAGVAAGGKSKAAPKRNWREEIGDEDFSDHDVPEPPMKLGTSPSRSRSRSPRQAAPPVKDSDSDVGGEDVEVADLDKVQTCGAMMVLSEEPGLRRGLKKPSPAFAWAFLRAAARTGFFDSTMFEKAYSAAATYISTTGERMLNPSAFEMLRQIDTLGARDKRLGQALAAAVLRAGQDCGEAASILAGWDGVRVQDLEDAAGSAAAQAQAAALAGKRPCVPFFKGQCKWGPKCRFSHVQDTFDTAANSASWAKSTSGSQGYLQSADMYKADRTGALW